MYYDEFLSVFQRPADATAFIRGSEKYPTINGIVQFYQTYSGVIVKAEIEGLPISQGVCSSNIYAIHIHAGTECTGNVTDPFANTGGHYNPNSCLHPQHAGDLPPLFGVSGNAFSINLVNLRTVQEIHGRTVIIHAMPDDFHTQPSGNSGEMIACGIIVPTAR